MGRTAVSFQSRLERRLRPPILNIRTISRDAEGNVREAYVPKQTVAWREENKTYTDPEFLFVCYTRDQFRTYEDIQQLHRLASQAASEAGLDAYWLDSRFSRIRSSPLVSSD